MTLEALPNELLAEVFKFLEVVDLFRSFHGLNSRFNTFLLAECRTYHIDFHAILKYQFDIFLRHYLPIIIDRIVSLRLPETNHFFFSSGLQLNQFLHLRSLLLCYINQEEIFHKIISDCIKLPHLTHLKIVRCHTKYMSSVGFSNIIWSLPTLTHCRLDLKDDFCLPTVVSSSILYLSISCRHWWLGQTSILFQKTPHLQRLHLPLNNLNDNIKLVLPVNLSITTLKLSNVRTVNAMKSILLAVPNLTHLKVDAYYINRTPNRWEEIIDNHLPKLRVFHLRMNIEIRDGKTVEKLIEPFRTKFWLEKHQWFIRYHHIFKQGFQFILLYSLPYTFTNFDSNMLITSYKSTSPQDNDYYSYDNVNYFSYKSDLFADRLSLIQFSNIRTLHIDLPFDKYFWQHVPSLDQLNSLTISTTSEYAKFHLQSLLDRTPYLYSLTIQSWPLSQLPVIENVSKSLRRLDLRMNGQVEESSPFFNREECIIFINSSLVRQCEEFLIKVEDYHSIIDLVNNMANLRILCIQYAISFISRYPANLQHLFRATIDSQFRSDCDYNEKLSQTFIKWLQDQLPAMCTISNSKYDYDRLNLWIYSKKP